MSKIRLNTAKFSHVYQVQGDMTHLAHWMDLREVFIVRVKVHGTTFDIDVKKRGEKRSNEQIPSCIVSERRWRK